MPSAVAKGSSFMPRPPVYSGDGTSDAVPGGRTDASFSPSVRTSAEVHGHVKRICFKTGPPRLVGAELEWIVAFASDPQAGVPVSQVQEALGAAGPLPGRSLLTFEPGGQLELSSRPVTGLSACWQALAADVDHLRGAFAGTGLTLSTTAIDPFRPPQRQLADPRYVGMETYFDRRGQAHVVAPGGRSPREPLQRIEDLVELLL